MGFLRLLLAFSVLEGHLAEQTNRPGFFGLGMLDNDTAVQIFFIISGFYMALILHEKYNRPGTYFLFLQQRFLRLYPAYLLILTFFLLIYGAVFLATAQPLGALFYWKHHLNIQTPSLFSSTAC